MAGSRPVSSATLTKAGAPQAEPLYLLEIDWSPIVYLCSHSTQSWGGQTWTGAGFAISSFDAAGKPTRLTLADPDNAYRTMVLGARITDKRIVLWHGYLGALATADPVCLFDGYADGCEFANGRAMIDLDWQTSNRQFSPRDRIGPLIGVNFVATPGEKINWNGQVLVIEARQ